MSSDFVCRRVHLRLIASLPSYDSKIRNGEKWTKDLNAGGFNEPDECEKKKAIQILWFKFNEAINCQSCPSGEIFSRLITLFPKLFFLQKVKKLRKIQLQLASKCKASSRSTRSAKLCLAALFVSFEAQINDA